ncbi:hypothetical protein [Aquibacillus salsiterrae]|uniref:Uncharacterized protein n=1 Tax=Aquibacillus salsiterrae TaxID=2950439 RepID=A0A9X3WDQ5_9BACI|nr:hypothetical protein [Aquibacillus salsiterrae]MDC3416571.1 hypothetical protein [Aquibacillus salsiterrae]
MELVGNCERCGRKVFCENGFLNGVNENNQLFCFPCSESSDDSREESNK